MLAIYRIGYHVPLPGVDQAAFLKLQQTQAGDSTAAGRLANYVSLFSGGNLSQSTIFGLGVMPYISSSIIFQLLTTVVPALEKLQKEGETGRRKIQEWTRYATIPLALVQAIFWLTYMHNSSPRLVQSTFADSASFWLIGLTALTAGCIFLMWLGEQIDEYGLGNGVSLIILAGIVARMPTAVSIIIHKFDVSGNSGDATAMTPGKILFLIFSFVFIVAGSILITQAQRRIPIQQAKHTRGRRVYGGQRQFLPLRVNHGGVMPIIFAQSLMLFPGVLLGWLNGLVNQGPGAHGWFGGLIQFFNEEFQRGGFIYIMT
jgi:preprotein translocase subunit SecY